VEKGRTVDPTYAARVGERLRAVRLQKGLSLHEVEEASGAEFKASVLGAYERGERAISVPRLQRLARFYAVPADRLLPESGDRHIVLDAADGNGKIRLDLTKLADADSTELAVVASFASMIQLARGDFNGKVLTLRADDARILAAVMDLTPEKLAARIDELGLRALV
jgi:transcriptional regulator with XRE-family HTH domain